MKYTIVDDEPIARRGIWKLAEQIDQLELIGSFENAEAAAGFMDNNLVDLVFLDIQTPGINGIDFAKQISATTLIIFTTAYAEFAVDSYEVDAIDYLLKPNRSYIINKERIGSFSNNDVFIDKYEIAISNACRDSLLMC